MSSTAAPALRPELPARLGWALGSGTILQGFNSSIIAVAVVSIGVFYGDPSALPWLVSGMYIACAVASPTAGRLVDLFGARRLYLTGLGIVLAGSLLGPFAPTLQALVAVRVLMGIGASIHFPAAMAVLRRSAAAQGGSNRRCIGTIALCGQTMAAIGPSIGGFLIVAGGWQAIFWANIPLVALSAVLVLCTVEADPRPEPRSFRAVVQLLDVPGLLLFVLALVALMAGLLELDGSLWTAGVLLAGSLGLGALFFWRELNAAQPFLDVRMLAGEPAVLRTCARAVLTFTAFYCVFYGLPLWFEGARGLNPAESGALMIPVFGAGVLSTMAATAAGRRLSPRWLLVIGGTAFVLGGVLVAVLWTTDSPVWLLAAVAAVLGVPNGFNNVGNQSVLQASAPADSIGVASGLYRTAQYIGAALSVVLVDAVLAAAAPGGGARLLGICIAAAGCVLTAVNMAAALRRT
ncbi:MFS transporter [Arthrobacter sp. 7Tela_A1]|uniref:MFS transporter n=1 Tax=Arthrobacter sp. 7Tela_A1 TaxID=3093745 RepID=UPI003BB67D96